MDEKIETIIRDMVQSYFACYNDISCGECEQRSLCSHYKFAKNLVGLNYRKESDAAKEIFEKIFEVLCCFTTQGKSKEYAEGYIDCLEEVDKRLQNLAKEKYGVDLGE